MSKPIGINVRRLLDILISIALIVAGACFIGGCLTIYHSAEGYSRGAVAAVFSKIAVPVYTAITLVLAGFVWELFAPATAICRNAPKAYGAQLARLREKRDQSAAPDTQRAIHREQTTRKTLAAVRAALTLVGSAVFFGFAVQPSRYTEDINASVIRAMWVAIPCFLVPAVFAVITAYCHSKSYQREIDLFKTLPLKSDIPVTEQAPVKPRRALTVLRAVLILLAIAALVYGFIAGGTVDVLTKAINICTECIGLG